MLATGETIFKVLNIESIFESVVTLMKKPVHAHLLLHSASAKLNLNKFSKMQRDVTLFAIQRSLEMETASGNETKKKTNLQDGESVNDIAENSSTSLRAQRHQIAINLLEQWYDNRVDTLNLIGDCIRFLKTDFEVKLSGGANGLLSIVSNNINASLPECVYVMLRKKLLMPSVDANVLNVLESEDDDERGKYVIEYNAPLAAMDREAKKELGKGSSTTVLVDKTPRRTKSDSLASLIMHF